MKLTKDNLRGLIKEVLSDEGAKAQVQTYQVKDDPKYGEFDVIKIIPDNVLTYKNGMIGGTRKDGSHFAYSYRTSSDAITGKLSFILGNKRNGAFTALTQTNAETMKLKSFLTEKIPSL